MEKGGFGAVIWTELKSLADEGVIIMSSKDEVQHSLRLGHWQCQVWSEASGKQMNLSERQRKGCRVEGGSKDMGVPSQWEVSSHTGQQSWCHVEWKLDENGSNIVCSLGLSDDACCRVLYHAEQTIALFWEARENGIPVFRRTGDQSLN